jgi:hypothetical protein
MRKFFFADNFSQEINWCKETIKLEFEKTVNQERFTRPEKKQVKIASYLPLESFLRIQKS